MQKFLLRRLYDGIFFIILIILLDRFAQSLHVHPSLPTTADHFILQAQAWLHGHLDIGVPIHDSVILHGKTYIIYPPLPSLMMLPFVAILGNHFSDVWFTWAIAALNIILLFRTLEVMRVRHITNRTPIENFILAITFGFGTVALWLSLAGTVWFTGQIISIFGIMITLYGTVSRRWPLATLGIGMVLLTRTSEILIGIIPLTVYLHDLGVGRRIQRKWHFLPQRWPSILELAITLAPFLLAVLIFLVHNKLYFGSPLETGYDIQNQQMYPDIKYGVASWHYIWPNFIIDFLRGPSFVYASPFDVNPHPDLIMDGVGTSIFFTTPLLLIFIFAPQGKTPQPWLRNTLWATVAILLLTMLTFCAAGWYQVGARYLLALYPPLFLLLAQRADALNIRWIALAGLSILTNILIAHTFWLANPSNQYMAKCAALVLVACIIAIIALKLEKRHQKQTSPQSSSTPPTESIPNNEPAALSVAARGS